MRLWVSVGVMVWLLGALVSGQECFRDSIGLDPVQPTLTQAQWNAGLNAAAQIVPRLTNGTPSASGKVVLLFLGYSNTELVGKGFIWAVNTFGGVRSTVKIVNAGISGQTAEKWANPNHDAWSRLATKLANAGVTPAQVGATFIMGTEGTKLVDSQANAAQFAQHMRQIRANLTAKGFTNRKIDYLSSNFYGGYDVGQDKSPEPHVYYEGLTLQGLQDESNAVWASAASTYQWADGVRPRPWDGLTLLCPADVKLDGVHLKYELNQPTIGALKYGRWLYDNLRADPTTYGWFWP